REMLSTAGGAIARAGLAGRIALAQGDATDFDAHMLFGQPRFDRVLVSYALSMIPPWRTALAHALDLLAPGGELHCVDFGDGSGLPRVFRSGLRRWLKAFDVVPRDGLGETLLELAALRGLAASFEPWRGGYAAIAVARARG
ncbi:MAG: SAM-dependent methyltransferase, partial [Hyphomicrobiales bacterium]|nr:SAM-dependent methyltransferase [Hyphomicrobiales bacterium]